MKPILFNTEMVRAILDGRKTETRRVVKPQLSMPYCHEIDGEWFWTSKDADDDMMDWWPGYENGLRPPYRPGDILYVRETWTKLWYVDPNGYTHYDHPMYYYAADGIPDITLRDGDGFELDDQRIRWHPSIHMPKEAARLFLRVMGIRVERLQDITDEQALKEGAPEDSDYPLENPVYCPLCKGEGLISTLHPVSLGYMEVDCPNCDTPVKRFANLWNSTIKPAGLETYGWSANPWVWVIEFERITKEEAEHGTA